MTDPRRRDQFDNDENDEDAEPVEPPVDDGEHERIGSHDGRAPHVVMFRPNGIDHDTRGKKIALSLARGGYQVTSINAVPPGSADVEHQGELPEYRLGPVRVVTVELSNRHRGNHGIRLSARRRRTLRVIDWTSRDDYVTEMAELRRSVNDWRDRRLDDPGSVGAKAGHFASRAALIARRQRWRLQAGLNVGVRQAWRTWDGVRLNTDFLATDHGTLPELEDYADSFGRVLDELEADVLHAHHPTVLPLALRAARRIRARGGQCLVVYDARENFAGIPAREQGNVRRHAVLLRQESQTIREMAGVITVSEPIADVLQQRYDLPERPTVLLNAPPYTVDSADKADIPTLRAQIGLAADVPLAVYSGGISRARGIETLIDALPHMPGVHLALVTVPFPHPMTPELQERATELGVADRLHVLPPVDQSRLKAFLASADIAVHPLPGGSPNHDQAMPNKLFEYLHSGLPLVVSDARLMAQFVRENDLGEVFPTGDAAALGAAVLTAIERFSGGDRGKDLAALYSWQAQEPKLLELYRRIAPLPPELAEEHLKLPDEFPDLEVTACE